MAFDPYRKWLGIPAAEQPPNHYRLLGIALFESDPDVIDTAADLRMSHLRTYQTGPNSALSQKLLNEVAAAKLCLLDPSRKAVYDAELRRRVDVARPPVPAAPIAAPMAPMPVRAVAPMPLAGAMPMVAYTSSPGRAAIPEEDSQLKQLAVDTRIEPARSEGRVKLDRRWLAVAGLWGIAVGLWLGWLFMSGSGRSEGEQSAEKPSGKSGAGASLQNEFAQMLRSIERPGSLGVKAKKLVLWNAHSGPNNDVGALECNVRLLAGDREIWSKQAVAVPWAPNEDRSLTLALPPERFDRVRVEITKWEKGVGGLAEIQVLSADGRNLALGCPATASGALHGRVGPEHITDGVTTSAEIDVGAWLLPAWNKGWVEVDLSLPRPADLAGVTAEELVIWNQHNGPPNNSGTQYCDVTLLVGDRTVWRQNLVELPWAAGQDLSLALKLPRLRFDRVRIQAMPRPDQWAGLAEVQVMREGRDLALHCPAIAAGVFDEWRNGSRVTDGIVSSQVESVGYWLLWQKTPGWVEIDLACLDAKYGAACRQLGLALALVDGDWQRGLRWLARGDNRMLRRLAVADLQDVWDTPEQLALADAWWDLAQQAEGETKKRLLARSLWRYRQALPKLREFRKTQVQSRINEALPSLPERDYLYFISEAELKLGWGQFREVMPISVLGVRSPYGLFMHPGPNDTSSHAAFPLAKHYRRFRGAAAINDSAWYGAATALTFRIVADGRQLWKSPPLKAPGSSQPFDVDVADVDKLELFVDCPGPSQTAHGVWIEPRCER
ncbi:MAG TPA: NPCBM/NEW2 domain-containing protein [Pirellulales bacterium]|nr:NPCBM/NEW2 domain-containing protein [Pirellulales bacterium]